MASRTHSTVERHSTGNLTLSIVKFSDIDTGDTYESGIPSIVALWANGTDVPSITDEGIGVSDVEGTVTFTSGEDNRIVTLYLLSRT